jgi:glycosyltransferase involved in cell wall biosynthesis
MNIISSKRISQLARETIDFDEEYRGIKIVTVGRLSKEKGQDMAIKVLHQLRQDEHEVRWYCVGEGNKKEEYEQLIAHYGLENDFILVGSTVNPYPYMARADIYIQPSRHEGFCQTLAEAKCLNRPIITTDFTGAHEQIIDRQNGIIIGIDEQELYQKIKWLIDNPEKREELSHNLSKMNVDTTEEVAKILAYAEQ